LTFFVCFSLLLRILITKTFKVVDVITYFYYLFHLNLNLSNILYSSSNNSDGDNDDNSNENDDTHDQDDEDNQDDDHNDAEEIIDDLEEVDKAWHGDREAFEKVKAKYPQFFDEESGNSNHADRGIRQVRDMLENDLHAEFTEERESDIRPNKRKHDEEETEDEIDSHRNKRRKYDDDDDDDDGNDDGSGGFGEPNNNIPDNIEDGSGNNPRNIDLDIDNDIIRERIGSILEEIGSFLLFRYYYIYKFIYSNILYSLCIYVFIVFILLNNIIITKNTQNKK
jgi:hypothetical protein